MPERKLDFKRLAREMNIKPPFDDVMFSLLSQISYQSTGVRRQGAILVKNGSIIATGYFDAYEQPPAQKSQDKKEEEEQVKEKGSGAIENAIADCARHGISTEGATVYTYAFPNDIQCKLIVKAGVIGIKFLKDTLGTSDGMKLCMSKKLNISKFERNQ